MWRSSYSLINFFLCFGISELGIRKLYLVSRSSQCCSIHAFALHNIKLTITTLLGRIVVSCGSQRPSFVYQIRVKLCRNHWPWCRTHPKFHRIWCILAKRISSLNHKFFYDPMKQQTVIKTRFCLGNKVISVLRR